MTHKWKGEVVVFATTNPCYEEVCIRAASKKQYWFLAYRLRDQKEKEGFVVEIHNPALTDEQGSLF